MVPGALSGRLGWCNRAADAELTASPQLQRGAGSGGYHILGLAARGVLPAASRSDRELVALHQKYSRERLTVRRRESGE